MRNTENTVAKRALLAFAQGFAMPLHPDIRYLLEVRPRAREVTVQAHRLPSGMSMIRIGRDPKSDIEISDTTVSWWHCMISRRPEGLYIKDLDSTNGTDVCGIPIPQDRWVPLLAASHIELGDVFLFPADREQRVAIAAFSRSEWLARAGLFYGIEQAAARFGVHTRTIYRKMKKLRSRKELS